MQTELPLETPPQAEDKRKMDKLILTQLVRIEAKVDKHGEALERLARTEERVTVLLESFKELTSKDLKLEARIIALEQEVNEARTVGRTWKRTLQIIAAATLIFLGNRYSEIMSDLRHFVADTIKGPTQ